MNKKIIIIFAIILLFSLNLLPLNFAKADALQDVVEIVPGATISNTAVNAPAQISVLNFKLQIKPSATKDVAIYTFTVKYKTDDYSNNSDYFNSFKLYRLVNNQIAEGPAVATANLIGETISFADNSTGGALNIIEHGQYTDFTVVADIKENIPLGKKFSFEFGGLTGTSGFSSNVNSADYYLL